MAKYQVEYRRDESGWWQARVPAVAGCHTQGRTVDEARRRIREALDLFVDDAAHVKLIDDVRLPAAVSKSVKLFKLCQREVTQAKLLAARRARRVVQQLKEGDLQLSTRDTAEILGMSHQRVSQLMQARRG